MALLMQFQTQRQTETCSQCGETILPGLSSYRIVRDQETGQVVARYHLEKDRNCVARAGIGYLDTEYPE